jgi:D-3-phosphoglycerate dehydrogenase
MKPKILITDRIHKQAIDEAGEFADVTLDFGITPEDLVKKIPVYDALIVRSATEVTEDVIKASNLKIIGRAGVGLDNIDLNAAREKGVMVVNSPEASTISVTELVFGSLIALMRNIVHAHHSMSGGMWERSRFGGNELFGKTLGVIGFGRIGREVAMRAKAFGMDVMVYDPNITEEDCREFNTKYSKLSDLLKDSDVITLHMPLTNETRDLIDEEELRLMKESAVIVNIARGGIVNEDSLYKALKGNRIRGAVLDVYESEPPEGSPLVSLDNVVLTPHLGASTEEAQISAGTVVVEKIRNFFRDKP